MSLIINSDYVIVILFTLECCVNKTKSSKQMLHSDLNDSQKISRIEVRVTGKLWERFTSIAFVALSNTPTRF